MRRTFSYVSKNILFVLILLIFIIFFLVLIVFVNFYFNKGNILISYIIIILELILFGIATFLFRYGNRFLKGSDGEWEVKNILKELPQGYFVLEDVFLSKKGNIDFVVIGPTGIWAIEVKNYRKKEIIRDKSLDHNLKQAFSESRELQDFINGNLGMSLPTMSVLVFAKGIIRFGMVPINGVYVIGKSWLLELLTKHVSSVLNPQQCFEIMEKLKVYTSRF